MGVDLIVLADHRLPVEMLPLVDARLIPCLTSIEQHAQVWRKWWSPPVKWPTQLPRQPPLVWSQPAAIESADTPFYEVNGPYGISLEFSSVFCRISPTPRWSSFVSDEATEAAVRALCRAVGQCIGATTLAYLPDSAYCASHVAVDYEEFGSFTAALEWLLFNCGPPASAVRLIERLLTDEEMHKLAGGWNGDAETRLSETDGYFIERMV